MIVCQAFPSGISDRFIGTISAGGSSGAGGSTTNFNSLDTFLFHTIGNSVLISFGDCDLLRRL